MRAWMARQATMNASISAVIGGVRQADADAAPRRALRHSPIASSTWLSRHLARRARRAGGNARCPPGRRRSPPSPPPGRAPRKASCWAAAPPRAPKIRASGETATSSCSRLARSAAIRSASARWCLAKAPPQRQTRQSQPRFPCRRGGAAPARRRSEAAQDGRLVGEDERARRPAGRRSCATDSARKSTPSAAMSTGMRPSACTASQKT